MNDIILFSISGEDQPGVTTKITQILAKYNCHILDIGQAVIHDTLSLGIVAEVPAESEGAPVLKEVLFGFHDSELNVRFEAINEEEYARWVSAQGKPRHIVTLLARRITAKQIASLTAIVAKHNLNIDKINRLSGRMSLQTPVESSKACVEFSVSGFLDDPQRVRRDFLELAGELDADIAYQEDSIFRRNRRLIVFDMDSTLIEAEVIDELAKHAGVGEQVAAITERAMQGEIDFIESFSSRVALLKGLDERVLAEVAQQLPITEGVEKLMPILKKLGYKTAILSGGFNYFGRYLQDKLGFDYVYANELEIVDGKVTGNVSGEVVDGKRKASLLKDIAAREKVALEQVIAVGDGANDLPMLSIAGLGIAFRAKPIVKQSAQHAISNLGLDSILYLMGFRDFETMME